MIPYIQKCPKCFSLDFWKTKDNRLKCKNCRCLFTPKINPFNIPNEVLEEIIFEFLMEHPINIILQRVKISKYKLLKVLTFLRKIITKDIPIEFKNMISLKNEPPINELKEPIIGILEKNGKIFARILNIEPDEVKNFLKKKEKTDFKEDWVKNFGLIFKGSFFRLNSEKKYQIDTLEAFWGYLKRKLSLKGGIRKEKLPLYLGEYVWRYNHKNLNLNEQKELLLNLLLKKF